jgi:ATP-dependent Clp protease, protease subunit
MKIHQRNYNRRFHPYMNSGDDSIQQKIKETIMKKIIGDDGDFGGNDKVSRIGNHIYFYSEVTTDSICKLNKEIFEASQELKYISIDYEIEPPMLFIHINSLGGELEVTLGTYDIIRKSDIPITTIIEGQAASAATLISIAAQHRYIRKNSSMLIHQLSGGMWGTFSEMEDEMENTKEAMEKLRNIYRERTKIPKKDLDEILKHDRFFDSTICKKFGMVDKII